MKSKKQAVRSGKQEQQDVRSKGTKQYASRAVRAEVIGENAMLTLYSLARNDLGDPS